MTRTITREKIMHTRDSQAAITIVETLPREYFDHEHLPGAINIPHDQIQALAPRMLPDKDALIVVYCASADCQNSAMAWQALHTMGYTNIFDYKEGKEDWKEAGFPLESNSEVMS